MNKCLLIVDVQNDYFPNGTLELVGIEKAASHCRELLSFFRKHQLPVIHIQHIAMHEGATFFLPNSYGCEINELVKPTDAESIVVKHFPSSFRGTELETLLRSGEIDELVICGAMTHMCIDTTVRAAFDLGFKCQVISDACATRNLTFQGHTVAASEVQTAFLAAFSSAFAEVLNAEQFLTKTTNFV